MYLIVIQDRHVDIEIIAFNCRQCALVFANERYETEAARHGGGPFEQIQTPDYWLWHRYYSTEGDSIYVIEIQIDQHECPGHAPRRG